ncbi:major allergen Pru ar 1-like [Tasmannia lanceolata]|uniref:major allergen Pru ar 1-like n=1 Tax=Tasmannia lanceolata TaxID=3420 RepID=UPI0040633BC3
MVVGSFYEEFKSPISPSRLWKAAIVDSHNLIPIVAPQYIASIELLQGGGAGTIKKINFTQAMKGVSYIKTRVDVLDENNFSYKYSVIEGNENYESASYEIKLEGSSDGGSVCKIRGEYKTVGDYVPTEEESKAGKEGSVNMFKAIEAYLVVNHNAYA